MINVAILGYGTVGSGVFEVLNTNKESITRRAGEELNVKYVLDLRDFPGQPFLMFYFFSAIHFRYALIKISIPPSSTASTFPVSSFVR